MVCGGLLETLIPGTSAGTTAHMIIKKVLMSQPYAGAVDDGEGTSINTVTGQTYSFLAPYLVRGYRATTAALGEVHPDRRAALREYPAGCALTMAST